MFGLAQLRSPRISALRLLGSRWTRLPDEDHQEFRDFAAKQNQSANALLAALPIRRSSRPYPPKPSRKRKADMAEMTKVVGEAGSNST
jgi:hypothetical protein